MLLKIVNFGVRSGENVFDINDEMFEKLVKNVVENCFLFYDIVKIFFFFDDFRKEKGVIYFLSFLMSLRNSYCRNDIIFVFILMLVVYGVGVCMINMFNRIGVIMYWDILMFFFDKYREKKF